MFRVKDAILLLLMGLWSVSIIHGLPIYSNAAMQQENEMLTNFNSVIHFAEPGAFEEAIHGAHLGAHAAHAVQEEDDDDEKRKKRLKEEEEIQAMLDYFENNQVLGNRVEDLLQQGEDPDTVGHLEKLDLAPQEGEDVGQVEQQSKQS